MRDRRAYQREYKRKARLAGVAFTKKSDAAGKARRLKHTSLIAELKSLCGCADCGEKEAVVLDLHHTDPANKDGAVSRLISRGASLSRLLAEVKKCVVLCANCHRRQHYTCVAQ